VLRMGTTKSAKNLVPPVLYGLNLRHSPTRLKYEEMGVVWDSLPDPDYCRTCGPGGGGEGGSWRTRERVVVDTDTWQGEDIFYPMNASGTILVSEKAARLILERKLTNVEVIACDDPKFRFRTR
jgi:hypothetical protein